MFTRILAIFVFSNQLIASKSDNAFNLIPDLNFPQLMEVLTKLPFSACLEHLMVIGDALAKGDQNAIKIVVLDACAKPQAGLLLGNVMHVGNYDECLEINDRISRHQIQGKYCTAIFQPHPKYGQEVAKLIDNLMGDFRTNDDEPTSSETAKLSYGFCLPKVCTAEDLQNITDLLEEYVQSPIHFSFNEEYCDGGDGRKLSNSAIFAIVVFSVFALLLVFGTLYEYIIYGDLDDVERKPSFLVAFSMISNGRKLLSTSTSQENLNCLNGLRVVSMMWIMLVHQIMSALQSPQINALKMMEWKDRTEYSFLLSSDMGVDTFFVVSGLLVVYLFMTHQSKGERFSLPVFYIHRLLRLTPSLAMVVLLTTTLFTHMGSGPFWPMVDEMFQKPCERNWWSTLTYFQIYINPNDQCVGQAWYVAVDTEMYFISPLILFPLIKWPKRTIGALVLFIVLNCSYVFEITWKKHLGTTFFNQDEVQYNYLYVPTHIRGTAYLIGMICGYFVYQTKTRTPLKLTKCMSVFLWLGSLSTMVAIVLAHSTLVSAPTYNVLDSSVFNSLTRVGWSIALSVMILLCVNDYGGAINSFLSNDVFNVLIRLNYSVYLLHLHVLVVFVAQGRTPTHISVLEKFHQFWGDYIFLLAASFIWTLAFESPVLAIEKILFRKSKNGDQVNGTRHLNNGILIEQG